MDFSSNLLETFIAVSESGSFSSATEKTHKSQAAISIQIAKLESQLGVKLLDRSGRPVGLTEAGRIFLSFAKQVINKGEEVNRHMEEIARGIAGEVRIGVTTSISNYLSAKLLSKVLSRYPKLNLSVLAQPRSIIWEAVRQTEVDFGLVISDSAPQNLVSKSLRNEILCFALSPKAAYARESHITAEKLQAIPLICGMKGTEYEDMVDTLLSKSGVLNYSVAVRISNLEGRKQAAIAGFGVTVLPRFAIEDEIRTKKLTTFTIKGVRLIETSLMLVERPNSIPTPSIHLVKEICAATLREPPTPSNRA
jgi:DNA-binding transcriptional LysR family regulator